MAKNKKRGSRNFIARSDSDGIDVVESGAGGSLYDVLSSLEESLKPG